MSTVLLNVDARGVATITLNRPDKHNALDAQLVGELDRTLRDVGNDARIRVVAITGAGKSFCAGADLRHMQAMNAASEQENYQDALALAHCLRRLARLDRPVIAKVNGSAYGGGVGLIACADIAIASSDAKFALTEARLGLVPAIISPYVTAAVGARQAKRLFLTAVAFDAGEAAGMGLIHIVDSASSLDAATEVQIGLLLQGGPHSQTQSKRLIDRLSTDGRDDAADEAGSTQDAWTARLLTDLRASDEGREGVAAFLEKRKPRWVP